MDRDAIEFAASIGGVREGSEAEREAFPGSTSPIIVLENGQRKIVASHFGLTPPWAKDADFGKKYAYNGRGESILEKPTFREPMLRGRRCLVRVVSFKENLGKNMWLHVFPKDPEARIYIAGLWEPANKHIASRSHCLVTTIPNSLIGPYHDRMPVILDDAEQELWLDPSTDPREAQKLIKPCQPDWLSFVEVDESAARRGRHQSHIDFDDE
ncbi:MAG: SOS response-associated peptidase family protein [Armatimonadetes bacterium]|nr:SOS response-associated peptidase family protein [Armatimonadota bacterium]